MTKQIDTTVEIARATDVWVQAQNAAEASLVVGQPFLGAFGIADSLGFERDSLDWSVAVSASSRVFRDYTIYTAEGRIYEFFKPL